MFVITIIAIALIVYIIEKNSVKNALDGIEYNQKPSLSIVEPNEEFDIVCVLKNRSRRFKSYLRLKERFSKEINIPTKREDYNYAYVESSQYMMPRQVLERRLRVSIPRRGRYLMYGATIFGGDFLGLTETVGIYETTEEIVVIPKETTVSNIDVKLNGYIGEMSVNRFIFEDPVLTVGFSEYTGQEPQKMISWLQTAKLGQLMVKKYDHTLELMVTVILNLDYVGEDSDELVEECFSICRTVCQYLDAKNIKYKVVSNAILEGSKQVFQDYKEFYWGKNYLMTVLEGLGRASSDIIKDSYEQMMEKAINFAESGVGHILITPNIDDVYSKEDAGSLFLIDKLKDISGHDVCILTPSSAINSNMNNEQGGE